MLLTNDDIKVMWASIFVKGQGKLELKLAGLPSRSQLRDIFQGIEDWFVRQRIPVREAFEEGQVSPKDPVQAIVSAVMERSIDLSATGKYWKAYTQWKLRRG